jgi:hypothetical protein
MEDYLLLLLGSVDFVVSGEFISVYGLFGLLGLAPLARARPTVGGGLPAYFRQ